MNVVILAGRVGTVRDLKRWDDGTGSLGFSLATSYRKPVGNGQYEDAVDWHECVLKGKRAISLEPHIRKGLGLTVQGILRAREYEHQGQKRKAVEVVVRELDFGAPPKGQQQTRPPASTRPQTDGPFAGDSESDLPF